MGRPKLSSTTKALFQELFPDRNIQQEWKSRPSKRSVASVSTLPISVDIEKLRQSYEELKDIPQGEFEKHVTEKIKGIPKGFTKRYYKSVLSLPTELSIEVQSRVDAERGMPWWEHMSKLSKFESVKALRYLNENYNPLMDERNYVHLHPRARGTYIEHLLKNLKSKPTRIRFAILRANEEVEPHMDTLTQYACRVHFPIFTNSDCFIGYYRNEIQRYHLAVGQAYMLNGGLTHWAVNHGTSDRIHLIFCTDGVEPNCFDTVPL